jgi:hypothetical protein
VPVVAVMSVPGEVYTYIYIHTYIQLYTYIYTYTYIYIYNLFNSARGGSDISPRRDASIPYRDKTPCPVKKYPRTSEYGKPLARPYISIEITCLEIPLRLKNLKGFYCVYLYKYVYIYIHIYINIYIFTNTYMYTYK